MTAGRRTPVWAAILALLAACAGSERPAPSTDSAPAPPTATTAHTAATVTGALEGGDPAAWASVPLRWSKLEVTRKLPSPMDSRGCAFLDVAGDRLVLFGGYKFGPSYEGKLFGDEIWTLAFAPEPTWTQLPGEGGKPIGRQGLVVVDEKHVRAVIFGGVTYLLPDKKFLDDLWSYDLESPGAFTPLRAPEPRPPALAASQFVYVPERNRVIVHGGVDWLVHAETWALDLDLAVPRWRLIAGAGGIGNRAFAFHFYDAKRDALVLVAGQRCYTGDCKAPGPLDAWALTGLSVPGEERWVQLALETELLTSAVGNRCAYDPKADRAVCQGLWLYPGWPESNKSTVGLAETWIIEPTGPRSVRMRRLDVGGSEPPAMRTDVHYDPKRDRFVFFGGWALGSSTLNETWVLERKPELASGCAATGAGGGVAP